MELCHVCSQLNLSLEHVKTQPLGPYEDILAKSHSIGPGGGGCGGCEFFCAVLQSSETWHSRISELAGRIVFISSMRLDVRKPDKIDSSSYAVDDLCFDVCTEKESTGMFLSYGRWRQ
jgi:hypothetical protein